MDLGKGKGKKREKISLFPLAYQEAVSGLLAVKPPPKKPKKKPTKKKTKPIAHVNRA